MTPSTLRMVIWPEASRAQNSIAAVSPDGSTVWVLIRRLNFLVQSLDRVYGPRRSPLARGQPEEGEQAIARLLEAAGHRRAAQAPLAQERAPLGLHLLGGRGIHHISVVGGDLVMQRIRRVRQQVAMLMHGAALGRHVRPQRRERPFQPGGTVGDQE